MLLKVDMGWYGKKQNYNFKANPKKKGTPPKELHTDQNWEACPTRTWPQGLGLAAGLLAALPPNTEPQTLMLATPDQPSEENLPEVSAQSS